MDNDCTTTTMDSMDLPLKLSRPSIETLGQLLDQVLHGVLKKNKLPSMLVRVHHHSYRQLIIPQRRYTTTIWARQNKESLNVTNQIQVLFHYHFVFVLYFLVGFYIKFNPRETVNTSDFSFQITLNIIRIST
jgi:hypothetical protein